MSELSPVLISLFKGPIYRDSNEELWDSLVKQRAQIADYVAVLGLRAEVDETNGYGYLASAPDDDASPPLPRLISRHKLPFHTSLLLALLRKRLAEFDTDSTEGQLVVSTEQLSEMMRLYSPTQRTKPRSTRHRGQHQPGERPRVPPTTTGFGRPVRGAPHHPGVRRWTVPVRSRCRTRALPRSTLTGGATPMTLFDTVAPEARPGTRLQRFELYNWGTFDSVVWPFDIDGRNALLTGDIGSGKSTAVDALTTLLLPAHRISYNQRRRRRLQRTRPALIRARPLQVRTSRGHRLHPRRSGCAAHRTTR